MNYEPSLQEASLIKDCILIDETAPQMDKLLVKEESAANGVIDLVSGVNQRRRKLKRRFPTAQAYDQFKCAVFEGTSITLIGLVKYDTKTDSFSMTKLACVLTGGLSEARKCLQAKIEKLNRRKTEMAIIGTAALGISLYLLYRYLRESRNLHQY